MEKMRLGKTGMMVSRLGFGGIPIQRDTEEEAIAVVKQCLALGITYIDTAHAYTNSEVRIGKAIEGKRREDLILATKSNSRSRDGVERQLKFSLENLRTKYLDLYQLHGISDFKTMEKVLDPNGPMPMLENAKKEGVIRHIGVTSHQIDVAKELVKSDRFETLMFSLNFVTDEAVNELIPLCRERGIGFIAMKPLAGGMLDNVNLAFKYLLQFPDVLPIVGIEKVHEIDEIVQVLKGPQGLTESEKIEMQRIRQELGSRFCHRCDYCQPCTAEIPISMVLTSRSFARRLPVERMFSGEVAKALEKAGDCTECGECEERCPYHMPIRDLVAEHAKWFQEEKQKHPELATPPAA